ncbi:MAG: DUF2723 domain-containing protein [Bacteroidales bacterium]|nr:DUF2723 domain-containing protein [Bacteroidales bacterium]
MKFKHLNNILGWLVGIIATIVYFITMEPTVSWWDCGEYISTSYKLQVGHPPGAPLFQLIARFFTLFAGNDVTKVAMMVNAMSAICSGLTIVFLFWSITMIARKVWMKEDDASPWSRKIGVLAAGLVGALAYTFTESFWFNAVEGEVYAMSSFFTAVTFWAILKWERVADEPGSSRWIILIAYLIGLSIGVHLLNLLCIPAFVYVVYFKKWKKTSFGGFLVAGIISVALLWLINMFLVPQIVNLAGRFELFFVNTLGMPFNSGAIVYFALLIILIGLGLFFTQRFKLVIGNIAVLSFMFILIGYSSFFMLVIRANTNTPINENEPKDALSMLAYLNREQYGSWPLLYGPYYKAPISDASDGRPIYVKGKVTENGKEKDRYIITDDKVHSQPEYSSKTKTLFPRMWSSDPKKHIPTYESYRPKNKRGEFVGKKVKVRDISGYTQTFNKPTFFQNMHFFVDYQCHWMYWRYFMWNFVGRQNDIESQGELDHGNWISGINFIDSARLGNQSDIPDSMQNPGRTTYFFLPLILGLIGLVWMVVKDPKSSWVIFLLFFMTGLAIVIYLNQTPYQPRERDYSYAGSFYAFAIWIGLGALAIINLFETIIGKKHVAPNIIVTVLVTLICLGAVPGLMAYQGWDEHNRSGKTAAHDWAVNYLAQLPPNSVIFTRGDNDTFPLWYIQEVEGFRTDVRVVNYMLSSGYWYAHQMGRKVYDSERLPLTLTPQEYDNGVNESLPVYEDDNLKGQYIELKDVIDFIHNPRAVKYYTNGSTTHYVPVRTLKLTVDKEACVRNGIVPESMKDRIVDEIRWEIKDGYVYKNALLLLDFMASNNWERPVYFTSFSDMTGVLGIDKYLHMEGLSYRFIPVEVDAVDYYEDIGGVYRDGSYDLLVNKARWGCLNQEGVIPDRESMRNYEFARQSYARLALSLCEHQEYDSAIVVMDKFQEFFPDEKFHYGYRLYQFPELYYVCGDSLKGDDFMQKLAKNSCEKIDYYRSMEPKFVKYYAKEIELNMSILQQMQYYTLLFKRTDMGFQLDALIEERSKK